MSIIHVFDGKNRIRLNDTDHEFLEPIGNRYGLIGEEEYCKRKGYEMVFDTRIFTNINGKTNHLVLENDFVITQKIDAFLEELRKYNSGKNINETIITSLHPSHIVPIKIANDTRLNNIQDPRFRNVIIDSLFQDRKQFYFIVSKLFDSFTECNFIVFCTNLIEVLNDELKKEIYQESQHWNNLIKLLENNTVYLCEQTDTKDYFMSRVRYNSYEKEAYIVQKRRLIVENYPLIDKSFTEKNKSKWD